MKAGTYYIGDPCYVFDGSWAEILDSTNYLENATELLGREICAGGTAYGDGVYSDNEGHQYFVDAGLLSILPVDVLDIDCVHSVASVNKSAGMRIVEFARDFECSVDNGVFRFGHIVIDTANSEEELE